MTDMLMMALVLGVVTVAFAAISLAMIGWLRRSKR
jgi:hypothetical protein